MKNHYRTYGFFLLALIFLPAFSLYSKTDGVKWKKMKEISAEGYYSLEWSSSNSSTKIRYELQESSTPDFTESTPIYRGKDTATTLSGKKDGNYYYRVRSLTLDSPWSSVLKITVKHHSLKRAILFLSTGAFVFFATAFLLAAGYYREKNEIKLEKGRSLNE